MEVGDVAHHANALVEGAVLVVRSEAVLLQVVILDESVGVCSCVRLCICVGLERMCGHWA